MPASSSLSNRLYKREKLCSEAALERLFSGGKSAPGTEPVSAAIAYPWRAVWAARIPSRSGSGSPAGARFVISVPKKRLRKAVDRVKMRRRGREAYRLQHSLFRAPEPGIDIAFVYVANELVPYDRSAAAILRLLRKIMEHR